MQHEIAHGNRIEKYSFCMFNLNLMPMKRLWFTFLCLAGVLMFPACGDDDDSNDNANGNGTQDDLNVVYEDVTQNPQVMAEENEIQSGKLFTIESGSVTYNDGTVLSFVDYGRKFQLDFQERFSSMFWDGVCLYTLYHDNKTYTVVNGNNVLPYALGKVRPYVFNEVLWELTYKQSEKYDGYVPEDYLVKSEIIAGKSVKLYGEKKEDGTQQFMGGWNRILFYNGDADSSSPNTLVAVSIKESYSGSFTMPSGYTTALSFGF